MNLVNYIKKNPVQSLGALTALILVFKFLNTKKSSNLDTSDIIEQENENSELQLSYPLSNYNIMADQLQAAMFDTGTDEDTIYNVFKKLKNPKDLLQLIKSFGIRPYYVFGWNQGNYNLGQWLTEELNISEIQNINSILRASNINYSF